MRKGSLNVEERETEEGKREEKRERERGKRREGREKVIKRTKN